MNVLNLPMMDSAVMKKMQKDKPQGSDGSNPAHDSECKSKKRGHVPEEFAASLRTMGIETDKKKMRTEGDPSNASGTNEDKDSDMEVDAHEGNPGNTSSSHHGRGANASGLDASLIMKF